MKKMNTPGTLLMVAICFGTAFSISLAGPAEREFANRIDKALENAIDNDKPYESTKQIVGATRDYGNHVADEIVDTIYHDIQGNERGTDRGSGGNDSGGNDNSGKSEFKDQHSSKF